MEYTIHEIYKWEKWGYKILMGVALIFILTGLWIIYSEVHGAREFCRSVNGTSSFTGNTCDGYKIAKYKDGWDFVSNREPTGFNVTLDISGNGED